MNLHLSPSVKLRPDGGRAILFVVNPSDNDDGDAFRFLYPQQAVMLSLFDGTRDLQEIARQVAFLFNLDLAAAADQLESLLELPVSSERSIMHLLKEDTHNGAVRQYNPADFVVPTDAIDMNGVRCVLPHTALVLPTMRCATDCIYCYADRRGMQCRKEFDLKLFQKILKEIAACGIETVDFSGGDFFCRPDAFELVAETFRQGLYPVIPTKMPLTAENARRLAAMGLKTIQISVDAVTPEVIDQMMQRTGYGRKILQTIDALGDAGIRVRTNTVLTPINMHDVAALILHLIQRPFVMKSNITWYARSIYRHDDGLFVRPKTIKDVEAAIDDIIAANPERRITYSGPNADYFAGSPEEKAGSYRQRAFCSANRGAFVVLPDGRVTICEELYFHPDFIIGDLNHNTLQEVWHSPKALALATPDQKAVPDGACRDCDMYRQCHDYLGRCYRDAIKAYGYDLAHWPDPRCPNAPRGNPFVADESLHNSSGFKTFNVG